MGHDPLVDCKPMLDVGRPFLSQASNPLYRSLWASECHAVPTKATSGFFQSSSLPQNDLKKLFPGFRVFFRSFGVPQRPSRVGHQPEATQKRLLRSPVAPTRITTQTRWIMEWERLGTTAKRNLWQWVDPFRSYVMSWCHLQTFSNDIITKLPGCRAVQVLAGRWAHSEQVV